ESKGDGMPADAPGVVCPRLKVILEDAGICKVVAGADAQPVEIPRTRVGNAETRKELAAEEIDIHIAGSELLGGARVSELADKTDSLLPGSIGGQASRVVEGKNLAACVQRLRKAEYLAHCKWTGRGIILKVVFGGQPVFGAKQVVYIAVDLVCAKRAGRTAFESVATSTLDLSHCEARR